MAGPAPIVALPQLLNLDGLVAAIRQNRHPIFNATGQQVGSYETLDAACQGQWLKFTGVTQPPPSQLYVRDFWGRKVPLSTQCTRAAQATAKGGTITQPQPVQAASAAAAVAAANQAATGSPATPGFDFTWPGSVADDFGTPSLDPASLQRWAIYGGLGLVGLLLLTSPGGRRR